MASCRQSSRFPECIEGNFLSQVIGTPIRVDAILDLVLTNARELISGAKTGISLGCIDHTLVEFTVLGDMGKVSNIVRIPNFRKANFWLFKELVNRAAWGIVLRDRGAEQSWHIFKNAFHRVQELSVPRYKKSGKEGKGPARGNFTGSGSRDRYPGKSIGMLPSCVGMTSGRPRCSWS